MISIVVPAYNEEDVIEESVTKLETAVKIGEPFEILVVDDGSTDRTPRILESLCKKYGNVSVVTHRPNKGFGAAIRTGIKEAKGRIIVTMDADLTHPAGMVSEMVAELDSGYDVCIASRYVGKGGMRGVPAWRVLLSLFTNLVFSVIFLTSVRDLTGGFKAYKAEAVKKVRITRTDFSVQMEIIVALLKRRARIAELPLVLMNRTKGVSKFNFAKNAPKYMRAVFGLFWYRWLGAV